MTDREILRIKEYGLLCYKKALHMAFLPDGIVLAKLLNGLNVEFLSVLEVKTRVKPLEEEKEHELAELHGKYICISLYNADGGERFKELVPDIQHRVQLLHGMACGTLLSAFYVIASTTKIIRVMHVHTNNDMLCNYRRGLKSIVNVANLDWIKSRNIPIFPQEEYDKGFLIHVKDAELLRCTLDLWHCINSKVLESGSPLPAAKFILPKLVSYWNRYKCPARHPKLSATGHIWLRMIMSCSCNAFMSFALNGSMWYLLQSPNCIGFRDYQIHRNTNAGDFKAFLVEIACSMALFHIESIIATPPTIEPPVQRVSVFYNSRR
jgi:hypothetical protein